MPRICSGLDQESFRSIRDIIHDLFKTTNIKIFIHNNLKEINLTDRASILAQVDEKRVQITKRFTQMKKTS